MAGLPANCYTILFYIFRLVGLHLRLCQPSDLGCTKNSQWTTLRFYNFEKIRKWWYADPLGERCANYRSTAVASARKKYGYYTALVVCNKWHNLTADLKYLYYELEMSTNFVFVKVINSHQSKTQAREQRSSATGRCTGYLVMADYTPWTIKMAVHL